MICTICGGDNHGAYSCKHRVVETVTAPQLRTYINDRLDKGIRCTALAFTNGRLSVAFVKQLKRDLELRSEYECLVVDYDPYVALDRMAADFKVQSAAARGAYQ